MKIRAELKEKLEVQTFGEWENEFRKQTLIFVETEPEVEYPNTIAIDFSNDRLSLAWAMDVWKIYDINYSVNCKKTEKGVFNTIRWRKVVEVGWNEIETEPVEEEKDAIPF